MGKGLIGGVIGGALAALAVVYLVPREDAQVTALQTKIQELETTVAAGGEQSARVDELAAQIEGLSGAPDPAIAALTGRLEAIEAAGTTGAAVPDEVVERIAALEDQPGVPAGLTERLDAIDAALANASGGEPGDGPSDALVADLQARLDALETAAAAPATESAAASSEGASAPDMAALEQRFTEIESRLNEAASGPGAAAVAATAALDGQIADLDQRLVAGETAAAGFGTELATVTEQLGAVDQRVTTLGDTVDTLGGRVDAVETQASAAADEAAAAEAAREQGAVLALITAQLDGAVRRAEPYVEPLEHLVALAGDDETLAAAAAQLEPTATTGVPSLVDLQTGFRTVAGDIVHQTRAPAGDGLFDRAASNLMRLVSVRPVGDVTGDDAAARVARAEARLAERDLAGAVDELGQLDGPAADAATGWLAQAEQRLAAAAAVADLQARTTDLLIQAR